MKNQKGKWLLIPIILGAIVLYLRAHPPVPPKPATVTVAQGTSLEVRLDRTVSSKTSASGERFTGKLADDLSINGQVIVPKGTEFTGTILQAVPAGQLAGGASLRMGLNSFSVDGKDYPVQTTPYVRVAKGQGQRTAKMTGGGAAIGAAIGALARGKKGALIGAAVGAGAGAVGSAATNTARDIVMPKECVVSFKLTQDLVVTPKPVQPQHTSLLAMIRGLLS